MFFSAKCQRLLKYTPSIQDIDESYKTIDGQDEDKSQVSQAEKHREVIWDTRPKFPIKIVIVLK